MTTSKQELAIQNMVENGGNMSKAMIDAGYSFNTARTPQKLTNSKGFKEICEEHGLTDNFLLDALVEDIENKKGDRKAELELAFKIKGRLIQKTDITSKDKQLNSSLIFTKEEIENVNRALEQLHNR